MKHITKQAMQSSIIRGYLHTLDKISFCQKCIAYSVGYFVYCNRRSSRCCTQYIFWQSNPLPSCSVWISVLLCNNPTLLTTRTTPTWRIMSTSCMHGLENNAYFDIADADADAGAVISAQRELNRC